MGTKVAMRAHVTKEPVRLDLDGESILEIGVVVDQWRRGGDDRWTDTLQCLEIQIHDGDGPTMVKGDHILIRGELEHDDRTGGQRLVRSTITTMEAAR